MRKEKLDIIYEDKNIIVLNKPSHLLTISDANESHKTLYNQVSSYVKKQHKSNKIFIVHRLDKDTSGVILLAKNFKVKEYLQQNWNKVASREYYAIVEGYVEPLRQKIVQYLTETKTLMTIPTDKKHGKEAITTYEVIKRTKSYSILNIKIATGRRNQIRVAMQAIGHPIIGDKKYGATKNPLRRLCLHAHTLTIADLSNGKSMTFTASIPKEFKIF